MGAMSMTFTGTVEIVEQDAAAHRVVMSVKSKEAGGQGHANAKVVITLRDGGGTIHTNAQITAGEVPRDGGTAIQEDADRPVFHGNGPDDYVCVACGNVLAVAMHPVQMTKKVRVRCGRCSTVNVSVIDGYEAPGG